jgi:hypothetical protein
MRISIDLTDQQFAELTMDCAAAGVSHQDAIVKRVFSPVRFVFDDKDRSSVNLQVDNNYSMADVLSIFAQFGERINAMIGTAPEHIWTKPMREVRAEFSSYFNVPEKEKP